MASNSIIGTLSALARFRSLELGESALYQRILLAGIAVLLRLPVGVGKSSLVDRLVTYLLTIEDGVFDLVFIIAPSHRILNERAFLKDHQIAPKCRIFKGRPSELCNSVYPKEWSAYEKSGSICLGKQVLCTRCPMRESCWWPDQFQRLNSDIKIVLLPHSYLQINPGVLLYIMKKIGASSPLIILDECNFLQESFRRSIIPAHIVQLHAAARQFLQDNPQLRSLSEYVFHLELLLKASTKELRSSGWIFPQLNPDLAADIQRIGLQMFPTDFYFAGYDLNALALQHPAYREKKNDGHIVFRCLPKLEETSGKLLILSGTVSKLLLEYRLEISVEEFFEGQQFRHQESRFYNLNIGQGIAGYHQQHLKQIADFAVQYLLRLMRQNKSLALVTKKRFVSETIDVINAAFDRAYLTKVRAVPADEWVNQPDDGILLIPLLHYGGAVGYNTFEEIDAVLCLAGYYMRTDELNRLINEVSTDSVASAYRIKTATDPLRRTVVPANPGGVQHRLLNTLAQEVLMQEELGVVVQAVGRVRPFTRPREVIACQMGVHPGMAYDQEFTSLDEAREFFGLKTERCRAAWKNYIRVQYYRFLHGLQAKQQDAAAQLGISLRTVSTYWNNYNR